MPLNQPVKLYKGGNQRWPEIHAWTAMCLGMGIRTYVELGLGSSYLLQGEGLSGVTVDILANEALNHLQGDSHDPETLKRVIEKLGCFPDMVFIDADHEAEMVKRDFDLWYPVAQHIIGFHDILMPSVIPFWHSIRRQYPSIEIVAKDIASANEWQVGSNSDGDVGCGGIGVIFKVTV